MMRSYTAQYKMLLLCTKTVLRELRKFELVLSDEGEEEKKKNIVTVGDFLGSIGTFMMSFCAAKSLVSYGNMHVNMNGTLP